ncbi:MAG: excinuclease ABC subunit UvrA [Sphingobacteriales bacterium]|nr:excinuclease ABC subunit UvrA [Sphingobacteriales bacterium]
MAKKNTSAPTATKQEIEAIEVVGAKVHNLKNINVQLPRNSLCVITGISGSGKSSLAFDTIFAEGQRRYMESFSAYARQFVGGFERPDVEKINGLTPVVSIEQKSTNRNPRSTVGTVTELYDFLRLLYARTADAYSYITNKPMVRFSEAQMIEFISTHYAQQAIVLLAPLVKGRKGHYRELFEQIRKQGYVRVRVDGEMLEIVPKMQLDRYKVHDIEVVIDRFTVEEKNHLRLRESLQRALHSGKDIVMVQTHQGGDLKTLSKNLMCADSGIAYEEPSPNTFSFNSPYGACPVCKGLGRIPKADLDLIIPDPTLSIEVGGLAPLGEERDTYTYAKIKALAAKYQFSLKQPIEQLPKAALDLILYGSEKGQPVTETIGYGTKRWYDLEFEGLCNIVLRCSQDNDAQSLQRWAEQYIRHLRCDDCGGTRLKQEARYYKIDGKNIAELVEMDLSVLYEWFKDIEPRLSERQRSIAHDLLKEIRARLEFLLNVGLDYLSLNRPTASLSGGESQRIRLATQIGSQLVGITYILDEPSIGLHQRDNHRLIHSLKNLRDSGNTVLVVEHDRDIMLAADHIVDLGPGAGILGGKVVNEGTAAQFRQQHSLTADYLSRRKDIELPHERRNGNGKTLILRGARGHNLKNIDLHLPLGTFIAITGVSGSGKSSLITDTLYPVLMQHFYRSKRAALNYDSIEGLEHLDKIIEIDQSPIGRTPRSNPATYIKLFDEIRNIYAKLPEAQVRGYKAGRFSFNMKGGRCETCEGGGMRIIAMNFLPDVSVLCETCLGKRYNRETLEVRYKGKSINDVLNMNVHEALDFFEHFPKIAQKIKTLQEVGLGYITLGQAATTLSGGEAQRIKLAAELSKRASGKTLYILDEPSTGLHFEDVRMLLEVLQKLADKGNTVVVIEHNLDIIKVADYVVDMGKEGGKGGGEILFAGTPEALAECAESYTGQFLKEELLQMQGTEQAS